jgi:hypothetical protein
VLYTRRELLDMMQQQDNAALLIALAWQVTRFNPNEIAGERYGLCAIHIKHARGIEPLQLLNPIVSIPLASDLLTTLGLVQYCDYELAHLLVPIQALADSLKLTRSLTNSLAS